MVGKNVKASLIKAQNNIKKKFKKAYNDRINKEKKLSETFKPITSRIDNLIKKPNGIQAKHTPRNVEHLINGEDNYNDDDDNQWDYYDFNNSDERMSIDDGNDEGGSQHYKTAKKRIQGSDDSRGSGSKIKKFGSNTESDESDDLYMYMNDNEEPVLIRSPKKRMRDPEDDPYKDGSSAKDLKESILRQQREEVRKARKQKLKNLRPAPDIPNIFSENFPIRKNPLLPLATRRKIAVLKKGTSKIALKNKKRADSQLKHTAKTYKRLKRKPKTRNDDDDDDEEEGEPQPSTSAIKHGAPRLRKKREKKLVSKSSKIQKSTVGEDVGSIQSVTPARRSVRIASREVVQAPGRRSERISSRESVTYGEGIESEFIPYSNNRTVFQYFDDPNELCERLRLLLASQSAGNTNHTAEINSIVEELRELRLIE